MATHRCLVQAMVVGVNDGSVLYPACLQCYAKMLHNLHTDVWQCLRCNLRCRESELSWRYRLSLCVADTSATCHLSLFGGTLVPHFGCSANSFHQFLHTTTTTTTTDMNAVIVDEDLILQAVQTTLVGNRYIFCLKTSALPQHSTSPTVHPAPVSTHSTVSRPLCLADLMSGVLVSQRSGEKLSDFVAVQMFPVGTASIADSPTVLSVLKGLVCRHLPCSSQAERQGGDVSRQEPRKEGRVSPGKSGPRNRSFANKCSYNMGIQGRQGAEEQACTVRDDDEEDVKVDESSHQTVLSEESSFDPWSQSSGNGQAMLRFSCQSSMDQEFPSSSGCSVTGYMAADSSHCGENPNCAGETSKEIKALVDGFDSSQYSDVSCSQTAPSLAAEGNCDSLHLSGQDPLCYTKNVRERKFSSTHQNNSDSTDVLVLNCDNCDTSSVNRPLVDRLNTTDVFHKVSVINKTRAEDETVLDSQTTLANVAQYDNIMSIERGVCEERACQPQDTHSQQQMAETQDQNTSFSSSLNDSSLLLAAVHVNPHLEHRITHDQSSSESLVRNREESLERSSLKQSEVVTVCGYVDKQEEGGELGQERAVSRRLDSVEDMPFSEDLSMFLQIMGEDPTSVDSTSPWTAIDRNQHQQHTVVSKYYGAEHQEHCIDKQEEDSKMQQKGQDTCNHKEHTSLQQKGQDTHNQKERIRTQPRQDIHNNEKIFTRTRPKQQDLFNQKRLTRTQETKQYSYRRKRCRRTRKKGQETMQDRVLDTAVHEVHNKSLRRQKTLAEKQHGIVETRNHDATHLKRSSMAQRGSHNTVQTRTLNSSKLHREYSSVPQKTQQTGQFEIYPTFCDTPKFEKTKEHGRPCEMKTTTSQNIIQVPSVRAAKLHGATEEHKLQSCDYEESVCMSQHTTQSPLSDSTVSMYRSRAEQCDEHDVRPTDTLASLMGNIDTCTINDTDENGLTSVVGDVNAGQVNDATRICQPRPPEILKNTSTENGSCERNLLSPVQKLNLQGTRDGTRTVPASPVETSGISVVKDREKTHLKTAVKKGRFLQHFLLSVVIIKQHSH